MSLKCPPAWLVAPVSLYATRQKKARLRLRKPMAQVRYVGRHGARHAVIVRDFGKPKLRYFSDAEWEALRGDS